MSEFDFFSKKLFFGGHTKWCVTLEKVFIHFCERKFALPHRTFSGNLKNFGQKFLASPKICLPFTLMCRITVNTAHKALLFPLVRAPCMKLESKK